MDAVFVDTSALAKYYVQESGSEEFERFIRSDIVCHFSRLAVLEFRCLVARRRRAGTIMGQMETRILALFHGHVGQGLWHVQPLEDGDLVEAGDLTDRLRQHPLRTLDAIHLAAAKRSGATQLATPDRVMAGAAKSLGLSPRVFG